ncbi:hypothetical protein ACQ4PT_030640 [Festuca glaucescens]
MRIIVRAYEQMRGVAGDQSSAQEDGWVICRVFKKKHLVASHQAAQGSAAVAKMAGGPAMERSPSNCSSTVTTGSEHAKATQMQHQHQHQQLLHYSASDDALDHILSHYMGRPSSTTCKQETKPAASSALDHLINNTTGGSTLYERYMKLPPLEHVVPGAGLLPPPPTEYGGSGGDWDTLDRLAAYELNGISDGSTKTNGAASMSSFFVDEHAAVAFSSSVSGAGDGDLWSLARSVSSLHADLTMHE